MMDGVNNENTQENNDPTSIEDALLRLRNDNQQSSSTTMGDASLEEITRTGSEEVQDESQTQSTERILDSGDPEGSGIDNTNVGGFTDSIQNVGERTEETLDSIESIDYGEVAKSYIKSTQKLAIDATNKIFQDNGISKVSINDLYEKDDRGRVSFNNPDDPDHPFQSRAEAQQWCDAFNAQVDAEWKRMVQNNQQGYMKDIQPMLRLMDFAPEFESMSPQEQKVFDNVVEGYAIKDKQGMTIGYSCDLNNAKQIALNICKDMGINSNQQEKQNNIEETKIQGSGPAVDAKTSGTGNPQNTIEDPKNLEEAMKMLAENKKKGNK